MWCVVRWFNLCFSPQCSAGHSRVWPKCQLPQSGLRKFVAPHPLVSVLNIYTFTTPVLIIVSFCPRLPSRRMWADRFVTPAVTASTLWLRELPWFEVLSAAKKQVLLKLALRLKCFWVENFKSLYWAIKTELSNWTSSQNHRFFHLDHFERIWFGNAVETHELFVVISFSLGNFSSRYWHRNHSWLLRCRKSQQLLFKHQVRYSKEPWHSLFVFPFSPFSTTTK